MFLSLLLVLAAPLNTNTELIDHGNGTKTVRVYAEDQFYGKTLEPIELDLNKQGKKWRSEKNTLKTEINEDSSILRVENGIDYLELEPFDVEGKTVRTPEHVNRTLNKLKLRGFAINADIEYEIRGGMIKEIITLESGPQSKVTLAWKYQSNQDPVLERNGSISFGQNIKLPPPVSWDANHESLKSHFVLRQRGLALVVDATNAVYPITIDPTVTTASSDVLGTITTGSSGALEEYEHMFLRLTAPVISWSAISAATLYLKPAYADTGFGNQASAYYVAADHVWTNATDAATMNALSMGTTLGTNTFDQSVGTYDPIDVLGDATKGVLKTYTDGTPSSLTFKFTWDSADGVNTAAFTQLILGDEGDGWTDWYESGVGNFPYLEITYTEAPSGPTAIEKGAAFLGG